MLYTSRKKSDASQCDLTPIIDIVFLLIIFFMIVCTFISAENFEVEIPDDIETAQDAQVDPPQTVTLTAMLEDGEVVYAVGSARISVPASGELLGSLTDQLDAQLAKLPEDKRLVDLRIDKDIPYKYCQNVLAAINRSSASKINIAVTKEKRFAAE
ncbi:protein TolR [Anaerohalosphaera lusitana]|uniref:Protein TolR n=1 Tax=Anaerohalosphaera lusitana TaxID=1936003 RepID=A0A1U9NKH1_9BACT|nr:biopolymer transporter ExbD [Anaerohalosphaera lusitana]AQT68421.1 protein TolR [Anaerohalosphaera lusitana]